MVTDAYIAQAAMRFDTVVSRAFLRALGILVPLHAPRVGVVVSMESYSEIEYCFANHDSPMDRLHG